MRDHASFILPTIFSAFRCSLQAQKTKLWTKYVPTHLVYSTSPSIQSARAAPRLFPQTLLPCPHTSPPLGCLSCRLSDTPVHFGFFPDRQAEGLPSAKPRSSLMRATEWSLSIRSLHRVMMAWTWGDDSTGWSLPACLYPRKVSFQARRGWLDSSVNLSAVSPSQESGV